MANINSARNTTIQALSIVGISFALGLLFDYFFFGKALGIAFLLYVGLILAGLVTLTTLLKKKPSKQSLLLFIPLLFFAAMVFVRASYLLTFLNVVACILLLLLITHSFFGQSLKSYLLSDYRKLLVLPFRFIGQSTEPLSLALAPKEFRNHKYAMRIVRGVLISLPVLFIFLALFVSADMIFEKYVTDILSFEFTEEQVWRCILVLLVTIGLSGAYAYTLKSKKKVEKKKSGLTIIKEVESYVLLTLVNILFALFVFIQIKYLFGGEAELFSQGFTYAKYARKGFFELLVVALLAFALLWNTEKVFSLRKEGSTRAFKFLSSVLAIQVMLIMASSFQRLLLYEHAYGFTTMRLYSHVFVVWLGVIYLLFLLKVFIDSKEEKFIFRAFISMIVFLVCMNLTNPDAFIARKNIERFQETGKLDNWYLASGLSSDAVEEVILVLDMPETNQRYFAKRMLRNMDTFTKDSLYNRWQSIHLSRNKALKILEPRRAEIEALKNLEG